MVIAYLMKVKKWSLTRALEEVKSRRPIICPNEGFINQLQLFEAMSCKLDKSFLPFKMYKLAFIHGQVVKTKVLPPYVKASLQSTTTTDNGGCWQQSSTSSMTSILASSPSNNSTTSSGSGDTATTISQNVSINKGNMRSMRYYHVQLIFCEIKYKSTTMLSYEKSQIRCTTFYV